MLSAAFAVFALVSVSATGGISISPTLVRELLFQEIAEMFSAQTIVASLTQAVSSPI